MNKQTILFPLLLTIAATTAIFGQAAPGVATAVTPKSNDIAYALGKPAFESTAETLNTKVWIVTQAEYKKLMTTGAGPAMGKTKDTSIAGEKTAKDAAVTGTHYFIFDVTNITSGKRSESVV